MFSKKTLPTIKKQQSIWMSNTLGLRMQILLVNEGTQAFSLLFHEKSPDIEMCMKPIWEAEWLTGWDHVYKAYVAFP